MLTKIYEQNPSERELRKVVDALEDGGIIIYPTDSVYAFGCSLRSPKAIERLRRMKGKDAEAFTVVFENLAQAAEYCRVDNAAFRILKRNLPGPFTFVLTASSGMPDKALEKRRTIGIRIPGNAVPRAIVAALGCPLITTSVKDDDEVVEYTTDPELIHAKPRHAGDRRRRRRQCADDGRGSHGRRTRNPARGQGRIAMIGN